MRTLALVTFAALTVPASSWAVTRRVGAGEMYTTAAAAAAASVNGDVIEITAGTYREEVVWARNNLTIRAVGGRVLFDRTGMTLTAQGGKGIFIVDGADITIEGIEFQGAHADGGNNGAGIRWQGGGTLTVRSCVFRDNENGILGGNVATANAVIEQNEFVGNGRGDLGYTHNLYINEIDTLTFRANWSHALVAEGADVGHLFKSRARRNFVLYNRLTAEGAHSSYELQLTGGGVSYVIGNLLQQGTGGMGGNPAMISVGNDGTQWPGSRVFIVNNTLVNDRPSGTFVAVLNGTIPTRVINNLFVGPGTATSGAMVTAMNNVSTTAPLFTDRAMYDYRLLAGSPAINQGVDPGADGAMSLLATSQYVHPRSTAARVAVGAIDVGAYELAGGTTVTDAGADVVVLDAAPSDATVSDVPAPSDVVSASDATARDAAISADGAPSADAGTPPATPGGCGCRTGGGSSRAPAGLMSLAALALVLARRRAR